jgi:ABC-type sugar transport system substrate-binding protein
MRRRDFIRLLGGAAAWPVDALAQQAGKVWRMGFIAHGHEPFYDGLFEGLREYGYDEGRNLIVERRYARGQAERFKEFAAEMVRLNVDIIIVVTTPAALAVMNATKTIPIVHPNAIDPLNTGLIASLAHPGGNLTGGAQLTAEASAKRLQILKTVVPGLSHAAALWNPGNSAIVFSWKETQGAARAGTDSSIPRGARTEGLCSRFRGDRRRTPERAPRVAGRGDDAAAKRDHRLRDKRTATKHVSRERLGRGRWSDVLWGEPRFYVSARRLLRGQDFQRRKAR